MWERRPDGGVRYHLADGAGSVGDFAQKVASHPGGADTTSQTSAFGFRTIVTTFTGGGSGTEACSTSKNTVITDIETLLQDLLPGNPTSASQAESGPIRRDWATVVYFSRGKAGHGAKRCPELNETFPFMLVGWKAEKVGRCCTMSGSGVMPGGKRRLIRGGGQPPGSIIKLDSRTLVVARRNSLSPGISPRRGRCFNLHCNQ